MDNRLKFLKKVTPFNLLPDATLETVIAALGEIKYRKETVAYQQELTPMLGVDILIKGQYESFFYDSNQNKRLREVHQEGHCYGGISVLMNRGKSLRTVIASKGTVVYTLSAAHFQSLCNEFEAFYHHFTVEFSRRMLNEEFAHFFKRPVSFEESFVASDSIYSRKMEHLELREIVSCQGDEPIYEAARQMAIHKVSCLFVKDGPENIIGYVTDITLRDNVIARQGDASQPVRTIMDNPIVTVDSDAYVYEAILMMFRTKTRYLLVQRDGHYIGFQSRNKLLAEQAQSPLVFIQSVKSALSDDELRRKWEAVPQIVSQLLNRGVNAEIVNEVITTVADTIAVKVIEHVIEEMGQPPARFVFMVLGSEGRKEQTLVTDQDNAIIYEDKANEHREEVREYFLAFAKSVSERLDSIGFSFCKGNFMAMNPEWTHSLSHWKRNYKAWMDDSLPETSIKFSTFFDCRALYGDFAIFDELQDFLDAELQKPMEKLFYHMAKNALQYEPPLTSTFLFKNIRTFTVGSQEVFDIKTAMTPIVDLVRMYALQNRIFEVNTGERLKALKEKGIFTEAQLQELIQSYYFLMSMRLKKQASQIIYDKTAPDNNISPYSLTKIERATLMEIFKIIENFQTGIKVKFTSSLFS